MATTMVMPEILVQDEYNFTFLTYVKKSCNISFLYCKITFFENSGGSSKLQKHN